MIGVGGLVIIRCMTAGTSVGRIVVVAVVAGGAIIGNRGMRAVQRIIVVVYGKSGGLPGIGGVTARAIRRYSQCGVARVGALVVIRRMTTRTVGGRSGVSGSMAVEAGGRQVRAGQREMRFIMVKGIVFTPRRMTGKAGRTAVRIAIYTIVMIVCFRIRMTGDAGKFRIIRGIGVAIGTLIPLPFV